MTCTGPDFMIIGAMKCGTTTLAAQLAAQPSIFITQPKEPNYFSDDAIYAQGADWYRGLYTEARMGDLTGEASTHYTKLPTHPDTVARISRDILAPKLIYMIRNPLVRTVSHYMHGWTTKEISIGLDRALDQHPELISYSCYGMQISPFVETFGVEAIYLTSLERLKAAPNAELARICAHLGYDQTPQWQQKMQAQNVSAKRFRALPAQRVLVDNPLAEFLRRRLVPKALRDRIRKTRSINIRPELTEAQTVRLREIFLQDRAQLAGYFPNSTALTDAYPFAPT